jgi:hypothetical protein
MKKFESYTLYINHPGRWEEVRQRRRDYFAQKKDLHMFRRLGGSAERLYEITEDTAPSGASQGYEN